MSRIYNPPTVTKGKVTSSSALQTAASRTTSPNVVIMRGTSVTVTSGSNGSNGLTRQYSADPMRLIKADTNPLSVRAQQTLTMLESQNEWKTERRKAAAMGSYRDTADNDWQQSLSEWKTRRRSDVAYQPKVLSLVPDEIDVDKIVEAKKASQRKIGTVDHLSQQGQGRRSLYNYQADEDNNNIEKLRDDDVQIRQQVNSDGDRVLTAIVSDDKKLTRDPAPPRDEQLTTNSFDEPTFVKSETRQVLATKPVVVSRGRRYDAPDAISYGIRQEKSSSEVDAYHHRNTLDNAQVTTATERCDRTAVAAPERNCDTVDEWRQANDRTRTQTSLEDRNPIHVAPPRHEEIFVDLNVESSLLVNKTTTEPCQAQTAAQSSSLQTSSHDIFDENCESLPKADSVDGVRQTVDADWLNREEEEQPQLICQDDEQIVETKISPTNSALAAEHRLYSGDEQQSAPLDLDNILTDPAGSSSCPLSPSADCPPPLPSLPPPSLSWKVFQSATDFDDDIDSPFGSPVKTAQQLGNGSGRTLSNHTSSNCHLTDAVNKHNATTAVESCGGKCQRETEKLPTGFEGLSKSGLANRFNGDTVAPDQNKSNAEIVATSNVYEGCTPHSESEGRVTTVNMQKKASDVDFIDGSEKTARYSQSQPTDETSACETRLTVKDLLKDCQSHSMTDCYSSISATGLHAKSRKPGSMHRMNASPKPKYLDNSAWIGRSAAKR